MVTCCSNLVQRTLKGALNSKDYIVLHHIVLHYFLVHYCFALVVHYFLALALFFFLLLVKLWDGLDPMFC